MDELESSIEYVELGDGIDRWQQFFELCLEYAMVAKQRAAEGDRDRLSGASDESNMGM